MPHDDIGEEPATQRLTNDDFRKLLMTPAVGASSSIRETIASSSSAPKVPSTERHEARRKKKNFYAQLKKQEDTKLAELAEKYRDRARERRDGANPDYTVDPSSATSAYRAVAPDIKSGFDAAERRRRLIQESKFLGGDMEHTHLVKGLDYALLQKVRSEIVVKEQEQEEEMEKLAQVEEVVEAPEKPEKSDEVEFKTALGRNVSRIIQIQRSRHVERNELFAPSRMAYLIELEDENAESDIPTTIIRSKTEVPTEIGDTQTLTTNDIVINKLAQILSYLRQGGKGKKNKKRDKDKPLFKLPEDKTEESIYDDIGEYKPRRHRDEPSHSSSRHHDSGGHSSKTSSDSRKQKSYFDKSSEQEEREAGAINIPAPPKFSAQMITKFAAEPEGYAECYPGLQEMNDAIDDSDDEVDYTKMDLGNKKGPIGRWDFDTPEEYSDYMSTKEALPKAAFQYGVKMQDGRKTRKHKTEKNEKAELDREWQKIQNIIHKRKATKSSENVDFKKAKH